MAKNALLSLWQTLVRKAGSKNIVAIAVFSLFVVLNSYKVTAFNHCIVAPDPCLPRCSDLVPAFLYKTVFFIFFFTLLMHIRLRLLLPFFYSVQALYIIVNVMYYWSFQGYLHINQYIGLFSEAFDLITHSALPHDYRSLFFLIDLPFLVGVVWFFPRLYALNKKYLFKPVFYGFALFFIVYFYFWEVPYQSPLRAMNNRYSSDVSVIKKYGLLTFNIVDLLHYKDARTLIKRFNYGTTFNGPDSGMQRPNILILQVESLDAYIVNKRYRKQYVTPFLHRLARTSIYFPYVLSYHMGGSTSDCEFSAINSVEPLHYYPSIKLRNYDYPNSLLTRLTRCGYATVAFHGNRGTYFNRSFAFKKMGFQTFYDMHAMKLRQVGWGIPDELVFEFVKPFLQSQKEPFYYHVITMSSHEPFTLIRSIYRNPYFDRIKEGTVRHFFNSMSYIDVQLEKFVTSMRKTCPNTVIFIFGDHTPAMPKCSYHKAIIRENHRIFEFVPLFILTPDRKRYRERKYAASFLDIAPTILAGAQCADSIKTQGLNLLDLPVSDKGVPYRGQVYSRRQLFKMIARNQ